MRNLKFLWNYSEFLRRFLPHRSHFWSHFQPDFKLRTMQKIQLNYVLSDDQLICLNPSPPPPLSSQRKKICMYFTSSKTPVRYVRHRRSFFRWYFTTCGFDRSQRLVGSGIHLAFWFLTLVIRHASFIYECKFSECTLRKVEEKHSRWTRYIHLSIIAPTISFFVR